MSARRVSIVTPEGAALEFEVASLSDRILAFSIDFGLMLLLCLLSLLVFAFLGAFLGALIPRLEVLDLMVAVAIFVLFVLRQFYFTISEAAWDGATIGKRAIGLRVIAADGASLRFDAVLARNFLREVELMLPLVMVSGDQILGTSPTWLWLPAMGWISLVLLLPLLTRRGQRAGDFVAGSLVVRVPTTRLLGDEAAQSVRTLELRLTTEQLSIYGEHELETLANVLRDAESGRATAEDVKVIARTIAKKIQLQHREVERAPLEFLRVFYRDQRRHLEDRLLVGKRKASKHDPQ